MSLDYRIAFDQAPIGLVISEHRLIKDCNRLVLEIFGAEREQLIGHSFALLLTFPEHRVHPLKSSCELPQRWALRGSHRAAAPGPRPAAARLRTPVNNFE